MPEEIYILAPDGTPLMPTKRKRHVDALVKAGKARVVSQVPMVVQILYKVERNTQPFKTVDYIFLAECCDKRLPSKKCILTKRNTGLVFVS